VTLALALAFALAAGATVGVAELGGGDGGSDGVVVGAPLAVIGPVDGVLGPNPEPATVAVPATEAGGGSGASGGGSSGGGSGAAGDPSAAISLLEPLVDADGSGTGEARFIDPCAPPEGDAGCEGTTAAIVGSDGLPPWEIFKIYPNRCNPSDPIFDERLRSEPFLVPTDGPIPVGTPFAIQSSLPGRFAVRAGLEPDSTDVTARAETEPGLVAEFNARVSTGELPQYVVTCIGIPFPDRTGLWTLEFTGDSLVTGATQTVEITYDTTSGRPRPPVVVEPPSDFVGYSRYDLLVTAPAFDHPTDPDRSREPEFDLLPGDTAGASCEGLGTHPIIGPDVRSTDRTGGTRRVVVPEDADSPYDPGWDRTVTARFGARVLDPATRYFVCVQWTDGRGEVVEQVVIPIMSPNRYEYRAMVTDIRFRKKTIPSALNVNVFGFCDIRPSTGPRPEPVRRVEDFEATACVYDLLVYPRGSLVGVATSGPAVPVVLTVPQGTVTRYIALPGTPCGIDAAPGSCGPLQFEEEFVLPLVDLDQGICGSGFPGRSCRNHRTAGTVTLRVTVDASNDPPAAAGWIVGDEGPPGGELRPEVLPCTSGCRFEVL
jgi:hypothetical protein